MKYYGKIIITTVLFGLILIGSAFAQTTPSLQVMSYNINVEQASWDAGRSEAVIAHIEALDADVIGLQEATSQHKSDIIDGLGDKWKLIDFNSANPDNNFDPILIRRNRLTILLAGATKIHQVCEDEGVGDRFINWTLLYDNETRQQFMFYTLYWTKNFS